MTVCPCTHRGDAIPGQTFNCGSARGIQPVFACKHPALDGTPCVLSMCQSREMFIGARLRSCARCNVRENPAEHRPDVLPIRERATDNLPRPGDDHRRILRERAERGAPQTEEENPAARVVPAFDGPIVRNLAYIICPFAGNFAWQRNVEQLLARFALFNGRRRVAIFTGDKLDPPSKVRDAFVGHDIEFLEMPNNPTLREVIAFRPLFDSLASLDNNETTFFAHAKGVTHPVNGGVTVHRWTDLMYETCLDYWPRVEKLLDQLPLAGSFKKIGRGFQGSMSEWHYSGTFYWLRHAGVFGRNWQRIDPHWWGTESWPGLHFQPAEAGCIFRRGNNPELDLYDFSYFNDSVMPHYRQWQREHAHERSAHAQG